MAGVVGELGPIIFCDDDDDDDLKLLDDVDPYSKREAPPFSSTELELAGQLKARIFILTGLVCTVTWKVQTGFV